MSPEDGLRTSSPLTQPLRPKCQLHTQDILFEQVNYHDVVEHIHFQNVTILYICDIVAGAEVMQGGW